MRYLQFIIGAILVFGSLWGGGYVISHVNPLWIQFCTLVTCFLFTMFGVVVLGNAASKLF
jgi:hypothetical protein